MEAFVKQSIKHSHLHTVRAKRLLAHYDFINIREQNR